MSPVNTFKYVFAAFGLLALLVGLGSCAHTRSFLARAARTQGTVIRMERVLTNDTTGHSYNNYSYRPVVRFEYQDQTIVFASQAASNPPSYSEGEIVPVLYLPYDPSNARIDSFFSLYGFAAIALGMGSIFFGIGAGTIYWQAKTGGTDDRLRHEGLPVTTTFQSVELSGLEVNGKHPFKVVTQGQDPVRTFKSHYVWLDPTQYVRQREITVYVDRADPQKYYMDLSFLPQGAA
jgi:hypothetical protein